MATDVRVVPTLNDPTVDADWRTASQAIEAALLAVGLTKMGGPAQMDLATVAAPGTPPAYATGFHYWQFNDAKQATRPVYIRTAYGRAATNRFALKVLVAGGFTSAGATIGWAMTEETVAPTTPTVSPTVTLRTYHGSYGAWMCLTNSGSLTANSWLWSVQRSWGGADFGDLLHKYRQDSTFFAEVADLAKLIAGGRTSSGALTGIPASLDAGIPLVGSDAAVWPFMCVAGRIEPVPGLIGFRTSEIGAGTFQADMLGAVRNYLQMAAMIGVGPLSGTGATFGAVWE
jgi:hypothetical protein